MKIILLISLFISLSSLACTEGEVITTPTGAVYVCDLTLGENAFRDPRGLVWVEGTDCEALNARAPEADEKINYDREMGLSSEKNFCVKHVIHHYFNFQRTPATPYTEEMLDFYSTKTAYGEFSNFSGFPVFVDGEWWSTSEHYFQAQKYLTDELRDWVQFAPTPMEAANRGRNPNYPKREDWLEVRDSYMLKALMDKYHRHPELTELLLSTGNSHIYEHTKNDCYWGDCGDRTGENRLGKQLMLVRESLR